MNLKQCQNQVKNIEEYLSEKKEDLARAYQEINWFEQKVEYNLAEINEHEKKLKGLRNLIMQLEGE